VDVLTRRRNLRIQARPRHLAGLLSFAAASAGKQAFERCRLASMKAELDARHHTTRFHFIKA